VDDANVGAFAAASMQRWWRGLLAQVYVFRDRVFRTTSRNFGDPRRRSAGGGTVEIMNGATQYDYRAAFIRRLCRRLPCGTVSHRRRCMTFSPGRMRACANLITTVIAAPPPGG
jgi:hypothetical protein